MRKNRNMYVLIIFVVALLFGIGYAVLNSDLNIAGSTKIKDNIWDVHFENINVTTGSVSPASPSDAPTIQNGTNVTYTITLDQPGDFFEFTVDTKNSGTINAMISSVANSGLTTEQKKYIDYSATYDSSASIAENQKLNAGKREVIRVKVGFKKDIDASDLPATDKVLNLTFSINYEQATSSAVAIAHPKCKRATTLHKETCSVSGTDGCKAVPTDAETITYGNRGTKGTLTAGDAFDCDVNKDGEYNSATERFYYITSLSSNTNYKVLVYYNNVYEGSPTSTTYAAYGSSSPTENGPVTAKTHLPTTSQWKNMTLSNTTRTITGDSGTEYVEFSYAGSAARLLTSQELADACGTWSYFTTGYLNSCNYLLENTKYSNDSYVSGYWLETPSSYSLSNVWTVYGTQRSITMTAPHSNSYGVRPVIEVPRTKISY